MTTKWEYKRSSFFPDEDVLNLWGSQGWEYIAAADDGRCLFKRPKPEETKVAQENAPEPEVSVTLTRSDMVFLQTKFSRWVYPKIDAQQMPQFARIETALKGALTKHDAIGFGV